MRKITFSLFILMLISFNYIVLAYDFSAINIDGDTIYYNITSSTSPNTVGVTYGANVYPYNDTMVYVGALNIPSTVVNNGITYSVTSIENKAFCSSPNLISVIIPNTVKSIGWEAFKYCTNLISITFPNSITSIGMYAFSFCVNLPSINLPDSINVINEGTFMRCESLSSITIPNSVTTIQHSAFSSCFALTSIIIPNSVTYMGISCFSGCSGLTSVVFSNSYYEISERTFLGCTGLNSIIIPNHIRKIGPYAFKNCTNLDSIIIPNSVLSIWNNVFENCTSLSSVSLPNTINTIKTSTFQNCTSLSTITLPYSLNSIQAGAFNNCSGLSSIICQSLPPTIGYIAFDGIPDSIPIIVPCNSLNQYQTSSHWAYFNNFIPSIICVSASDTNISTTSITLRAIATDFIYSQRGFIWKKLSDTNFNNQIITTLPFEHNIQNLVPNTYYVFLAYVVYNNETYFSLIDTFTTQQSLTINYSNITSNSVTLNAASSLSNYVSKGFEWRKLGESTFNTYIDNSSYFQYNLSNLLPFTQYEYRAFIEINNGISYSKLDTFYTLCSSGILSLPFIENFDTILTCWVNLSSNNDYLNSVSSGSYPTCNPHSGTKMIKYNSYIIQAGNYAALITPKIHITPTSKLSIWIYRHNDQWSKINEGLRFYANSFAPSLNNAVEFGFISNNRSVTPVVNADGWYNYIADIPLSLSGDSYIIIKAESQNGYSIYFDDLSITSSSFCLVNDTICEGQTYNFNGNVLNSAGQYLDTLQAINGGDSIIVLNLSVINTIVPENLEVNNFQFYFELIWQGQGDGYIIYRNSDSLGYATNTIYRDSSVIEGINYCYKVKSINRECESEFSQEICKVFLEIKHVEENNELKIILYPNPARNVVNIFIDGLLENSEVLVTDILGKEMKRKIANSNQKKLEINIEDLKEGVYNIIILNRKSKITKKLIVNY